MDVLSGRAVTVDRHRLKHHYGGWSPSRPDQRDKIADTSGLLTQPEVDKHAGLVVSMASLMVPSSIPIFMLALVWGDFRSLRVHCL